jgi:hypothetical protein
MIYGSNSESCLKNKFNRMRSFNKAILTITSLAFFTLLSVFPQNEIDAADGNKGCSFTITQQPCSPGGDPSNVMTICKGIYGDSGSGKCAAGGCGSGHTDVKCNSKLKAPGVGGVGAS